MVDVPASERVGASRGRVFQAVGWIAEVDCCGGVGQLGEFPAANQRLPNRIK
ncbi:hypothetical protein COLO4_33006 [Corchorus olitorius]|uniref:Uncharacterized protein n=1 Tax=Corchorus olitorius TaxID=93759 RepID=A0A1R3GX47_9ROSI|nr:hypothetical protein COLO4_33006 [Corchorus olitorius]